MIDYGYHVKLGPLDSSHNEKIRAWRNNPKIMQWCRQTTMINDQEQKGWYERQTHDPSIQMFMIYDIENREIGVCGLTSIDRRNQTAEFSIYIQPEHHRKGYGEAALRTLIDHAFMDLNLHVVWGETFAGNPAAHMFTRVGMKKEGTRRDFYFKRGTHIDADLYSITEVDWECARLLRPGNFTVG